MRKLAEAEQETLLARLEHDERVRRWESLPKAARERALAVLAEMMLLAASAEQAGAEHERAGTDRSGTP